MAASDWIMCRIHPDHPKVLALSRLTGDSPYEVTGRMIAWFRYVDQHCDQAETQLTEADIMRVLGVHKRRIKFVSYPAAMADPSVDWIGLSPAGTVVVKDYDSHFGKSSKRRAQTRLRVEKHRLKVRQVTPPQRYNGNAHSVTSGVTHSVTNVTLPAFGKSKDIEEIPIQQQENSVTPRAVTRPAPPPVAAAAVDFEGDLPAGTITALREAGVTANRRTQAVASQAAKAWGITTPAKIRALAAGLQSRGCGPGVLVEELDARSAAEIQRQRQLAERNARVRSQPVVGLTPEQVAESQIDQLKAIGWRRLRRVVRSLNLATRHPLRTSAHMRRAVLQAAEGAAPLLVLRR